jgi:hypothetical protein
MKKARKQSTAPLSCSLWTLESGFALAEFIISAAIIMSLSAGIFSMLTDVQSTSSYQTEVLSVMENTRVAMNTMERHIVQAGNNPLNIPGFTPVTATSPRDVRLCSDLTGSAGSDLGDPDGIIDDTDEDISFQYNYEDRSIEIVAGGATRTLSNYISLLTLEYYDVNGSPTMVGADVRRIRVIITGTSNAANPRTHKVFGLTLTGDFSIPNRW